MNRYFGALCVLLSLAIPDASAKSLVVSGRLSPDQTLPGIPVSVRISVENVTQSPIPLPRRFVVEVVNAETPPFLARGAWRNAVGLIPEIYVGSLLLLPGETHEYQIPLGNSLAFPGYLSDPTLLTPGTYRLRLIFDDTLTEDSAGAKGFYDRTAGRFVETNEMILQVQEPEGQDAGFLTDLRKEFKVETLGRLSPDRMIQVAQKYAHRYSDSRYTPWLKLLLPADSLEESFEQIALVLSMNLDAMLADRLRLSLAQTQRRLAVQAEFDGRAEDSARHLELARSLGARAETLATTPLGRLQAKEFRQQLRSADEMSRAMDH